ncbi:hypothetical protein ESZ36_02900 [Colwellia demingiae]|uniref:Alginate export domain-containing protein n=1 Tax=Colwellia demingiae TaxID=89401 RepID=A0A5C6QP10_9GAMM|nr:alginate export family protein [Colwellia demingiae]TWX70629.1 hypothetical protein ESZ36_02900 [Colwellia demingiae]
MTPKKIALCLSIALAGSCSSIVFAEDTMKSVNSITDALINGKTSANMNLRYEGVSQDNALKDASAFTLRTRLTYETGTFAGFSSLVEFEDSRVVAGIDDYNNTLGKNAGEYSVIADPETTELDQAFLQYKQDIFSVKAGRQVITMDNHRFVGHVGWRQDRQTFDALSLDFTPMKGMTLDYSYITQRNRIFAEAKDIDSNDHLLNASYKTGIGKVTAYGYLLEVDNDTDNSLDTFGLRLNGGKDITYSVEYATQSSESGGTSYDADYLLAEVGTKFSGIGLKLGYELLGSDDGNYGFSTPLATLHKFNGWSDQFLNSPKEGLQDLYASIGGKLAGVKWALVFHKFDADQASATVDDLGSEIDAVYKYSFTKNYSGGIKLAAYSAGDVGSGKVDTEKLWLWVNAKF